MCLTGRRYSCVFSCVFQCARMLYPRRHISCATGIHSLICSPLLKFRAYHGMRPKCHDGMRPECHENRNESFAFTHGKNDNNMKTKRKTSNNRQGLEDAIAHVKKLTTQATPLIPRSVLGYIMRGPEGWESPFPDTPEVLQVEVPPESKGAPPLTLDTSLLVVCMNTGPVVAESVATSPGLIFIGITLCSHVRLVCCRHIAYHAWLVIVLCSSPVQSLTQSTGLNGRYVFQMI